MIEMTDEPKKNSDQQQHEDDNTSTGKTFQTISLPQKRYYRQRAHSNPIADHCFDYPTTPDEMDWKSHYPDLYDGDKHQVEFVDIGCGYGGLLVELSPLFPETLMLGIEIRVKVSDYVIDRIKALRANNLGSDNNKYGNISCIRSNAMKYLPNFFRKSQLTKIFFLFPDPHFKKQKHKWRIISPQLLSEYSYFLKTDGLAYFASDVKDLYDWMYKHFSDHPLFEEVPKDQIDNDPVIPVIKLTEEAKKVKRNGGNIWISVFRRIQDPLLIKN